MSLEKAVEKAGQALDELEEAVLEYTMEADREPEEVAKLYAMLDNLSKAAGSTQGFMKALLEKLMGNGDIISIKDAGVTVTRRQGKNRKAWHHKAVRAAVTTALMNRHLNSQGQLDVSPSDLIQEAFNYTGLNWKVTQLRDVGINPSQYCEESDGKVTFSVEPAAPATETKEESEEDDDFI